MSPARPSLIIRTKLRPPRLGADIIQRESLSDRLEEARLLPAALISAPGGYGKTTLVAHWLANSGESYAWLTLDEHDEEPAVFLEYLVAALRTVAPDACAETLAAVRSTSLDDLAQVSALLLNELDSMSREVTLVLDEFHWIRDRDVLELMSALLRHPPAPLRLVLISRFDPPLPLARLRASGQLVDVRELDLRFSAEEVESFLAAGQTPAGPLDSGDSARLAETTQGWAVGLQLAKSRLRLGESLELVLGRLGAGADSIYRYLVDEVLATLPEGRRRQLLAVSLLDRFDDSSSRAVIEGGGSAAEGDDGEPFVAWARGRGLFVQPLDDDGRWFRFHPLFREVLEQELKRGFDTRTLEELHLRAGRWLEDYGVYEEALDHYEAAGAPDAAIALVERHRRELMSAEGWSRLQRWLERLPEASRCRRVELLLARAWLQEDRFDYLGLFETLGEVHEQVDTLASERSESWSAELDVLQAVSLYFEFDGAAMVELTGRALERLPEDLLHARGMALALHAWGLQMECNLQEAERSVLAALSDDRYRNTTVHGFGLAALGFIYWMEADLDRLERTAEELLDVAERRGLRKSAGYARYLLGVAHLEKFEFDAAEVSLGPLIGQRLPADLGNAFNSVFALALGLHERGQGAQAHELLRSATARALSLSHSELLSQCEACRAELALREGRITDVGDWVEQFEPSVFQLRNRLFQPELTYVKALILRGSSEDLLEAGKLLAQLEQHFASIHHRRSLLDIAVLSSLLEWRKDNRSDALERLRSAVEEAQPRDLRRPFTDVAPALDDLYSALDLPEAGARFLDSLAGIQAQGSEPGAPISMGPRPHRDCDGLVEALTDRELDVLERLAERYSNKEIAAQLGIASKTVKRHNSNLFSKLGVSGRREAVSRARELGLLEEEDTGSVG